MSRSLLLPATTILCAGLVSLGLYLAFGSRDSTNAFSGLDARGLTAESQPVDLSGEPANADAIRVEDTKLTYHPASTGGNFHTALVLIRNTSEQVAIDVGGQVSVLDAMKERASHRSGAPGVMPPGAICSPGRRRP